MLKKPVTAAGGGPGHLKTRRTGFITAAFFLTALLPSGCTQGHKAAVKPKDPAAVSLKKRTDCDNYAWMRCFHLNDDHARDRCEDSYYERCMKK